MSEKTELEIAKQTLKNSKDPAEREKVQQKYDALLEKDIASDKEVIAACSNGNAGSSACASARLKVIASKEGYEDGPYNSKYSQQYADAYGLLPALVFPERAIQLQLMSGVVYADCVQGGRYCSLQTSLATQQLFITAQVMLYHIDYWQRLFLYTQEAHQPVQIHVSRGIQHLLHTFCHD